MVRIIDAIETAIAKSLFFPIAAGLRSITGLDRNHISFAFFLAALMAGCIALAASDLFILAGGMAALAFMITVMFAIGRVNHRPITLIRIPFLAIVVFGTIPAILTGRMDLITPMIFYLFSDYNSMIPDAADSSAESDDDAR